MKHRIPLPRQIFGVIRVMEILEEITPSRIAQKKTKQENADAHLEVLQAVLETLDGLKEHIDMRESLE